jgi:hypothetical protein
MTNSEARKRAQERAGVTTPSPLAAAYASGYEAGRAEERAHWEKRIFDLLQRIKLA